METIDIELNRLFVKVVQQGSFSRAAELLRIPKSTVSKAVTKIEKITGTKLLIRTTRSQSLTEAGRLFYETCLGPVQILEDAQKSLFGQDSVVSGNIKLTAPEDLGTHLLSPIIGEICQSYPKISFDLRYTGEMLDLVKNGFDLAVRVGNLKESQLKSKKLGLIELIPVAAPTYLKKRSSLRSPHDLQDHECLGLSGSPLGRQWTLTNGKKTLKFPITRLRVESNQMSSLLKISVAGGGIFLAPHFLCRAELESGQLVRVLPGWSGEKMPVSLVSPLSIAATARLRLISQSISTALQKELQNPS